MATKAARAASELRDRDPATVSVADALAAYLQAKGEAAARPRELASQIGRLNDALGHLPIADVTEQTCRDYLGRFEWLLNR